jgi:hypothetical protein
VSDGDAADPLHAATIINVMQPSRRLVMGAGTFAAHDGSRNHNRPIKQGYLHSVRGRSGPLEIFQGECAAVVRDRLESKVA